MKDRSMEKELIDQGGFTQDEYFDCLKKLHQVGVVLGGDRATLRVLRKLSYVPESILEIGCGGGYFTKTLALSYPSAQVVGADLSESAIRFAEDQQKPLPSNLSYKVQSEKSLNEFDPVDIITTTLVCHHMTDDELVEFLREAASLAQKEVIINDLHRSWIAYLFYAVIAPIVFNNRLITHDGLLSIKRSFRKADWERIRERAKIRKSSWKLQWVFPFRWVVRIACEK